MSTSQSSPAAEGSRPAPAAKADPREARARTAPARFALIFAQLLALTGIVYVYQPSFFAVLAAATAGFFVHYWLPFRMKEPFWFVFAIVGGAYVAGAEGGVSAGNHLAAAQAMGLTVALALVIHLVVASPLPYSARVSAVAAIFGGVLWIGAYHRTALPIPGGFYRVFGVVFMFHVFMYLYEAKRFKARPGLKEFVRYFFMLPSFRLTLPFVDYQRLGQSYLQRDIHQVAQQGVLWIARGAVQYAVYLYASSHIWFATSPSDPRSPRIVAVHLLFAYCLYLRTSGLIHAFLGILHLFGYDLPEGYRWYWFSHRPIDFWRRCNIYWKDAMVKLAYYPVYFALRKKSDDGAKIVAMLAAFVLSWILHLWRLSWLSGLKLSTLRVMLTWPTENAYWLIFGTVATVDLWLELRAEKRRGAVPARRVLLDPKKEEQKGLAGLVAAARRRVVNQMALPVGMHPARVALQIAATWVLAASLFSLQHAPSIRVWVQTMKFW